MRVIGEAGRRFRADTASSAEIEWNDGLRMRQDGMTADRHSFWFAAAVFRKPQALAASVADLRAGNFASEQLVVLANHHAADARQVLADHGSSVQVVPMSAGRVVFDGTDRIPSALQAMLHALDEVDQVEASPIYVQLRRDVAEGAIVLLVGAETPEEQLLGARIMLRGDCDCVLTHEMTTPQK